MNWAEFYFKLSEMFKQFTFADWQKVLLIEVPFSSLKRQLKCTCTPKIFFDVWKGNSLEVHCTEI